MGKAEEEVCPAAVGVTGIRSHVKVAVPAMAKVADVGAAGIGKGAKK